MVVRQSPVPLYIQIDEELRGQIESGELGPLAQVPSETDLAERFSVSRMTARKALDRLVADGMLFRQPGKGTFVAPTKIAHGASDQKRLVPGVMQPIQHLQGGLGDIGARDGMLWARDDDGRMRLAVLLTVQMLNSRLSNEKAAV